MANKAIRINASETQHGHPNGVFTVKTIGLIVMAHDGFAEAERCRKRAPARARRLENMAESLIAVAAVILRHEEARVPLEVADMVTGIREELSTGKSKRRK